MASVRPSTQARWQRRILILGTVAVLVLVGGYAALVFFQRRVVESRAISGRWTDTLQAAEFLNRIHPGDQLAANAAARALIRMNRPIDADRYRAKATPLDKTDLHLLGNALIQAGETERAALVYEEITKRWPDDVPGLRRLAAMEMSRDHWDRAEALAKRLMTTPGGEVAGHTLAGSIYYQMGRTGVVAMIGMAVAEFERVISLDPALRSMPLPRTLFWSQFGDSLIREGRGRDARRFLETAIYELGEDAGLLTQMGQAFLADGEVALAEKSGRRARELDPRAPDPWLYLGRQALKNRDFSEAIRCLERASALAPLTIEPLYALAQAYRNQGNQTETDKVQTRIDQLRSLRMSDPTNPSNR